MQREVKGFPTDIALFFGLYPSSNFLMKHDVSEEGSASIFRFLIFVLVQVLLLSLLVNF